MNCSFCKIDPSHPAENGGVGVDREKERIIEESEKTFVIFSNPRLTKGHLLIIPKRHIEKISELTKEEREEIFDKVIKYQELILKKIAPGCDIRINYRPFLKENKVKVDHLHIHLIPREFNDALYKKSMIKEKEVFKNLTPQEVKEITSKLTS